MFCREKLLTAERNVVLQIFSYRGKLVSDADKLIDIGMTNQEDAILVSRIAVTIIDEACDSVQKTLMKDATNENDFIAINDMRQQKKGSMILLHHIRLWDKLSLASVLFL